MAVTTIYPSNFRDIPATLRAIADQVERGDFGAVGCAAVVTFGDALEVFGAGPDSDPASVAMTLHAAFLRLSGAMERHGRQ